MSCSSKPTIQEVCTLLGETQNSIVTTGERLEKLVVGNMSATRTHEDMICELKNRFEEARMKIDESNQNGSETRNAVKQLSQVIVECVINTKKIQSDTTQLAEELDTMKQLYENTIEAVIEKVDIDSIIRVVNNHSKALDTLQWHVVKEARLPEYSLNMSKRLLDLEESQTKNFMCTVLASLAAAVWAGAIGASLVYSNLTP